jgi:hypothetical protein
VTDAVICRMIACISATTSFCGRSSPLLQTARSTDHDGTPTTRQHRHIDAVAGAMVCGRPQLLPMTRQAALIMINQGVQAMDAAGPHVAAMAEGLVRMSKVHRSCTSLVVQLVTTITIFCSCPASSQSAHFWVHDPWLPGAVRSAAFDAMCQSRRCKHAWRYGAITRMDVPT